MKSKAILLILIFLLISCKKTDDQIIENEGAIAKEDKVNKQEFAPLFLGFTPYMSDYEFTEQINELNNQNQLVAGKFIISLNEHEFSFNIQKTSNTIRLTFSDQISKSKQNVSYELSDEYLASYSNKMKRLIGIYESKYQVKSKVFPSDVNLSSYGLKMEHYQFLQDSTKTVLIGFTLNGARYPSPSEQEFENTKSENVNSDHPLANIGKYVNTDDQNSDYVNFGLDVVIDYYYNHEFKKLYDKILKDNYENLNINSKQKQKEFERKKNSKNNVNSI